MMVLPGHLSAPGWSRTPSRATPTSFSGGNAGITLRRQRRHHSQAATPASLSGGNAAGRGQRNVVQATLVSAWCELREDFRHFRADHLCALEVLTDGFPVPGRSLMARWLTRFAADHAGDGGLLRRQL
jgi:hypothetical protein